MLREYWAPHSAARNLMLATIGFTVNFWAWALLGPLAPGVKERLGLSFAAQSLLVAIPVLVGSLGRIPVGALTDRFGARIMFPIVSLATVVPVLTLTVVSSYPALIVTGSFLGLGGTTFAVGVPLVSGWYPPARKGFALGVFGIGMGGTAIANFTTVKLADTYGPDTLSSSWRQSWSPTPLWRSCSSAMRQTARAPTAPRGRGPWTSAG